VSQGVITLIMVASALAAVVTVGASGIYKTIQAHWNIAASFVFASAWIYLLPSLYVQITGGRTVIDDVSNAGEVIVSQDVVNFQRFLTPVIVVLGLLVFLVALRRRYTINAAVAIGIVISFMVLAANALQGFKLIDTRQAAVICLLLGAVLLPRGRGAQLGVALAGLSVAVLSGLMTLFSFTDAVRDCRTDKCGPLGHLVLGVTTDENVLALILVAAMPAIFLVFKGVPRFLLMTYMLGMIWFTGSRTSLAAAGTVYAVAFVVRVDGSKPSSFMKGFVAQACTWLGIGIAFVLPHIGQSDASFTNRGYLWKLAIAQVKASPWLGLGGKEWETNTIYGAITNSSAYSVHNQWLDMLYTVGRIGLLLFVILVVVLIASAPRKHRDVAALLLLPMAFAGILERPWTFSSLDVFTWIFPAVALSIPSRRISEPQEGGGNHAAESVSQSLPSSRASISVGDASTSLLSTFDVERVVSS
jgi:O-Antigen ligase